MDRLRWVIFAVVIIAAIAGLAWVSNQKDAKNNSIDAFAIERSGVAADHVYGNPDAKVIWYEYGDFACPGCGAAFANVKQVKEKYKDQVAFVFRNFPLTTIHPNALAAATVAEAAGKQGKFWEMHDLLFSNGSSDTWESLGAETRTQVFEDFARQLSLNMDQYKKDLTIKDVTDKINNDRALGRKVGVDSTPTFYLAGQKLEGSTWQTVEALEKSVRDALTKAGVSDLPASPAAPGL